MIWMDVDIALAEVPVNVVPLVSDSDFKTVDEGILYNESGMLLFWHFTKTDGTTSVTAVTPTTSGLHDWGHQDHGIYTIEIPTASGDVNNTEEGFGYFTGICDNVLPWRGPTIGLRAASLNNALIDADGITGELAKLGTIPALDGAGQTIGAAIAKLADDNGGATFDATSDSLAAIASTIGQTAPTSHACSGVTKTTGTSSDTHSDAHTLDASYFTMANAGAAVDVRFDFNIGADRLPGEVIVVGRFQKDGGDPRMHFYAWNYVSSAFDQISNTDTAFKDSGGDKTKTNSFTSEHVDVAGTPGDMIVRFYSAAGVDDFRIDQLVVTSVPAAGMTLAGIAHAVWEHLVGDGHDAEGTAGYVLNRTRALATTVASGDTATSFTLTDGHDDADCYNGMIIMVEDETDEHYEVRKIVDYTSGKVVTVDRAFGFTPANGDDVYIMATGYSAAPTATQIWQLAAAIDGKTPQEAMRYIAAICAGEVSGAGTGTETVLGLDGSTTRVVATVDGDGNRSDMSYDP